MKIKEILNQAKKKFNRAEDLLAVEILLLFAIGKSKEFLITDTDYNLMDSELTDFENHMGRFLDNEPVAYIIQNKEFYGLDFYVDKNVLIPRPETEMLVDCVLDFIKKVPVKNDLKMIDVGTGSGAIAVAIAKNTANSFITAVDISPEAIEVAKKNALKNGVDQKIRFIVSDLLNVINSEHFDVIVANLPYIGTEKFNFVSDEAKKFEPHVALFGGVNGLFLYEKLFKQITEMPFKPALLLGEFGFLQSEEMVNLLNKYFVQQDIEIVKDLASIERMFVVRFPA